MIAGTNSRIRMWDSSYTGNLYASSIGAWNACASATATAYASASASDATAQDVIYFLIPDGA
jgi:hypothetical protein